MHPSNSLKRSSSSVDPADDNHKKRPSSIQIGPTQKQPRLNGSIVSTRTSSSLRIPPSGLLSQISTVSTRAAASSVTSRLSNSRPSSDLTNTDGTAVESQAIDRTIERITSTFLTKLFNKNRTSDRQVQLYYQGAQMLTNFLSDLISKDAGDDTKQRSFTLTSHARQFLNSLQKPSNKQKHDEVIELCCQIAKIMTSSEIDSDANSGMNVSDNNEIVSIQATFEEKAPTSLSNSDSINQSAPQDSDNALESLISKLKTLIHTILVSIDTGDCHSDLKESVETHTLEDNDNITFPHYDPTMPCGYSCAQNESQSEFNNESESRKFCSHIGARYTILRDTWMWPRCGGRGGMMSADTGRTTLAKCGSCGIQWKFNDFS